MTEKLFMFDFDGVLVDSLSVFEKALTEGFRKLGQPALSREDFLSLFDTNMFEALGPAGLTPAMQAELSQFLGPWLVKGLAQVTLFSGVKDMLTDLSAKAPVYVITSNDSTAVATYLKNQGVLQMQDILGSDKEPSKVKKIKDTLVKHPSAQGFYMGDTAGDVLEARAAGATAVAVAWGWHSQKRLEKVHPDHLAQTPEQLKAILLGAP